MKNKKILIIVFIIIDILILGFVGYNLLFGDLGKEKSNEEKYTLNVYKNGDRYCHYKNEFSACTEIGFTIETETNNTEILEFNDNFMLYNDNGLFIYDINKCSNYKYFTIYRIGG